MSQQRINSVQRFERMSKELQQEIRRDAIAELHKAADELVAKMKAAAPVYAGPPRPDVRPGALRDSIRKTSAPPGAKAPKPETQVFVVAGGPLTTRAYRSSPQYQRDVRIGTKDTRGIQKQAGGPGRKVYDYALAVEFGSKDGSPAAHPFFWPSWRLRRKKIRSQMRRKITANIKKRSAV